MDMIHQIAIIGKLFRLNCPRLIILYGILTHNIKETPEVSFNNYLQKTLLKVYNFFITKRKKILIHRQPKPKLASLPQPFAFRPNFPPMIFNKFFRDI